MPQVRWKRGTELPWPRAAPVAALGPADERQHPQPEVAQVAALLGRGELDVGLGPAARPVVLGAVELRRAHPVLARERERVLDPEPPLLGAVDEEQAAERPERLAAEVGAVLLVEHQHPAPGLDQFVGGDEPGQPGADDDHIGLVHRLRPLVVDMQPVNSRLRSGVRPGMAVRPGGPVRHSLKSVDRRHRDRASWDRFLETILVTVTPDPSTSQPRRESYARPAPARSPSHARARHDARPDRRPPVPRRGDRSKRAARIRGRARCDPGPRREPRARRGRLERPCREPPEPRRLQLAGVPAALPSDARDAARVRACEVPLVAAGGLHQRRRDPPRGQDDGAQLRRRLRAERVPDQHELGRRHDAVPVVCQQPAVRREVRARQPAVETPDRGLPARGREGRRDRRHERGLALGQLRAGRLQPQPGRRRPGPLLRRAPVPGRVRIRAASCRRSTRPHSAARARC